jgi:hypothetical protein
MLRDFLGPLAAVEGRQAFGCIGTNSGLPRVKNRLGCLKPP